MDRKRTAQYPRAVENANEWMIVLNIAIVTTTSHLYITSHTTRAVVFIPGLILFSESIGVNSATVVFLDRHELLCPTFPFTDAKIDSFQDLLDIAARTE